MLRNQYDYGSVMAEKIVLLTDNLELKRRSYADIGHLTMDPNRRVGKVEDRRP